MRHSVDTVPDVLEAVLPLDRSRMIAVIEGARRRAGARAQVLMLSKKEARRAWDEVERLGRLLYFVKFGKSAPNATAHEVSLYEHFMSERRRASAPPRRRGRSAG